MWFIKHCNKIIKHSLIMQYFIAYIPGYSSALVGHMCDCDRHGAGSGLAWRPHPFPHAKEERFSGRRALYQPTKVMFPVNDSVDNEFNYGGMSVYFEVHNCNDTKLLHM